ncbi:Protoheme IX farnesyltransferase 2 [Jeotgalicoccus aerolatus]|uniref:Protoheme IX farnesyltransferase n=1 Tax=Jeotgalicoccus aerolatus TaxID=709510 RepID=A0A1G8ZPT6_9STAP|nr:heme o synthase [Jeotgalicoccus aerolatus]MBP1951193.1 protoheme IX farnesyltransferase [Jeotgalicoccus aerolatus]NMA80700.1 protoheme IX farnesyltransferase [Jeotgalicoccus aerolatus]CAD2077682.1 Protoheme IX farnesyltransferase 2 [Jeotgalicoccus aerolatus]SDK16594.1 protoheme IX farnesyltransferase [Jeotgalicoccus aerolatus]GGD99507.1 protoheme IX farnesyltransferase [Jeotgalicoccus aerolatus]
MKTHNESSDTASKLINFFTDIKYLLKGKVLVANVLPVFTAYWLALHFNNESFSDHWLLFVLTMIGSTLVISGALMFNNWFEHDLDKKMDRTRRRPTVTGSFTLKGVLTAAIITTAAGMLMMMFTTLEAALYSFLGWFFYVVLYTFWSKRRYTINTIIGSISGSFTPLIGWAAIAPANHVIPVSLFYILFIWQIPHTLAIAIKRLEDYTRAGVPMLPVVIGVNATVRQNLYYVIALLPVPFVLLGTFGWIFFIVSMLLTVGWILLSIRGCTIQDKKRWANINLKYSLIYLIVLFMLMIVLTI